MADLNNVRDEQPKDASQIQWFLIVQYIRLWQEICTSKTYILFQPKALVYICMDIMLHVSVSVSIKLTCV